MIISSTKACFICNTKKKFLRASFYHSTVMLNNFHTTHATNILLRLALKRLSNHEFTVRRKGHNIAQEKIWGIKKSDLMILARGSSQENGFAVFTPPSSSLQHQPSFLWSQRFRVTPLTVAGLRHREMLGCLEKTESWFQIQFSVLYEEHDWKTFFSVIQLQQEAFAQC